MDIVLHEDDRYILKSLDWNADIEPGKTMKIGFLGEPGNVKTIPVNYRLVNQIVESEDGYEVDFNLTSDWGSAYNAELVITNTSDKVIEDWVLEFDFNSDIEEFWTAEILSHEENHYVVKNAGYNANITTDSSLKIGFTGNQGDLDVEPKNVILYSSIIDYYSYYKQKALNEILNFVYIDFPIIEEGYKYDYEIGVALYDEGQELEKEEKYYEASEKYKRSWQLLKEINCELSAISALIEQIKNSPFDDYDKDGLYNYFELDYFDGYINPLQVDSDQNGIGDSQEDFDFDGLTNIQEQEYKTHPNKYDTDGDTINDKREVELGLNPLIADTDGDGVDDNEEYIEQEVYFRDTGIEVEILAEGDIEGEIFASEIETIIENSNNIVPLYDINSDVDFDNATIKIPFDLENVPEGNVENLYMVYFDEELGTFVPLENQGVNIEDGFVWANTTHFSLYTIFYIENWDSYWEIPFNEAGRDIDDTTGELKYIDVMLVIDSSGSMSWNDDDGYRKIAAKRFVDALSPGDRVGITLGDRAGVVDFDSNAVLLQELTTDFELVKDAIDEIDESGGTNIGAGVSVANDELIEKSEDDRIKIQILLTDGDGSYSDTYTTKAVDNDIIIYTIGLGANVNTNLLSEIAGSTGGKYYQVDTADELPVIYDRIVDDTTNSVDTDEDGIPDTLELEGMRTGFYLDRLITTDPNNPDSDGDGLLDGEEILVYQAKEITLGGVKHKYYLMKSDPNKEDTDNDQLDDLEESEIGTILALADSDSDGLSDYDEYRIYSTIPLTADSDGDGYKDWYEIFMEDYDPNIKDSAIRSNGYYVIENDTTWENRVHVYANLKIAEYETLDLQPGTEVIIHPEGSARSFEIKVLGILETSKTGMLYDPVIIRKASSDERAWAGIQILDGGSLTLDNTVISDALTGVVVAGENSTVKLTGVTISDCGSSLAAYESTAFNGDDGKTIVDIDGSNIPSVYIEGQCDFSFDDSVATRINIGGEDGGAYSIADSHIKGGGIKVGRYDFNAEAPVYTVFIDGCNISDSYYGIKSEHLTSKVRVSNTNIYNNIYGVQIQKDGIVLVENNVSFFGNDQDIYSNMISDIMYSLSGLPIDFSIGYGDIKGIIEGVYGKDLITHEEMGIIERGLGFLCLAEVTKVVGIGSKITDFIDLRKLKGIAKVTDAVFESKAYFLLTNYGDEVAPFIEKYLDDFIETYIELGDEFIKLCYEYGDEAAEVIIEYGDEAVQSINKGIEPDLIKQLDEVGIPPSDYSTHGITGKDSALEVIEGTENLINGFKAETAYEAMSSGAVDDLIAKMGVDEYLRLEELSETMYDSFRAMDDDFIKIANNTDFTVDEVKAIKEHLFINEIKFESGAVRRFDGNYWQAEAWERLMNGTSEATDITLLKHELFELNYMKDHDVVYEVAHAKANELFNWSREVFGE